MKKLLNLCFAMLIASTMSANVIMPQAYLSELYFDSTGNWVIELGFHTWDLEMLDSIQIESSAGLATVSFYNLVSCGNTSLFDSIAVITTANMDISLLINMNGDSITLHSYCDGTPFPNSVGFSFNLDNSLIPVLLPGQSIAYVVFDGFQSFALDQSPTIGICNDTTGTIGILKGKVFIDGNLANGGYVRWYGTWENQLETTIDPDGIYTDRALSRRYESPYIDYSITPFYLPYPSENANTEGPFVYVITPGETTEKDLYFTLENIEENIIREPDNSIFSYPNPFSSEISFYVDMPSHSSDIASLEIYNLQGQKVADFIIQNKVEKIIWKPESNLPGGTYVYQLSNEDEIIQTGKIVKR
ncbi:MAG: T9SS type A sorting domain-containing protein [Bacteroidales bacterium]|nr:T9SS type A sorting domain-containing protein [Bacteroidales bacterium]MCF8457869.1 T9SS type A sorting domain-containing protein [Bacteroidales bacterium]